MSLFTKLFGGGKSTAAEAEAVTYKDFRITPAPIKESGGYRIGAFIRKEMDGALKEHHLIRADTLESEDAATNASISKAKQVIDEQGNRLFG